jgi:peptidoglycan-associated lipoprotein
MSMIRTGLLVVAVALAAAGCSSTNLDQKPAPVVDAKPAAPAAAPAPAASAPQPVRTVEAPAAPIDPLNAPGSLLAKRSVYFEFDRSGINDSDVAVVEAHGRYLVDHAARSVRVEGNCDERGGREYNLALGQRRADAVRDRLKGLGVGTARVETVSFGKEKPRSTGHDEASWADNRRADIVYK